MFSKTIKNEEFSFRGIKINNPFLAPLNNRLDVIYQIDSKFTESIRLNNKAKVNDCVIDIDTELRTDDIAKVLLKNQEQSLFEDRALGDTRLYRKMQRSGRSR